ncbi:MAG TPA: sigma 54-interacting transcriptional regulator, partial [Negativicutes bacterium]|nr:sigma 54-interacting transcriptional regulator [Negativicutes bacterium]
MKTSRVTNLSIRSLCSGGSSGQYGYGELFDCIPDGVCIVNELGQLCYANRAYGEILKLESKPVPGSSIYECVNDGVMLKALRERKNSKGLLKNTHGSFRISVSASPIFSGYNFKGVMAIYREEPGIQTDKACECILELSAQEDREEDYSDRFKDIISCSKAMKSALRIAYKASKASSTVLIRGGSGTGKELVAKSIHNNSARSKGPFVTVNCGAIPGTLLESELFGYEQGAFTGAVRRKLGKFEQANEGTIFLDEIGDMPPEMQVKLLRVIQEREFQRVGGMDTIKCNLRIIAATNRNLEEAIEKGEFREDLYYRINVIPICLPSLWERKEDIPMLVRHFTVKAGNAAGKSGIRLSEEALGCLCRYNWPGNVRELENLIERLVVLSDSDIIELQDLPSEISSLYDINENDNSCSLINIDESGRIATLEEYEREIITHALKRFGSFNAT